ncbi:mitochondrial 37S ribosomal uS2m domain-containing protein ASCRUDRAFT_48086 [Ascoidea rubescens DSM 1968]|uniref:Ribosomal protein S2 n=1 Tax=Ascoidea rubescens DSM 1968 TaxID=1344418 RepID=A0A1D2VES8_9ASCO|nr:hypothetical protein ASCRUDRAFT_48086 [Ascoidea rubescens DSM 1968]ODV60136.1 hypothetical protein ASCRUDRAFT_48086 [Ascoidea rubescens DSM 1968]
MLRSVLSTKLCFKPIVASTIKFRNFSALSYRFNDAKTPKDQQGFDSENIEDLGSLGDPNPDVNSQFNGEPIDIDKILSLENELFGNYKKIKEFEELDTFLSDPKVLSVLNNKSKVSLSKTDQNKDEKNKRVKINQKEDQENTEDIETKENVEVQEIIEEKTETSKDFDKEQNTSEDLVSNPTDNTFHLSLHEVENKILESFESSVKKFNEIPSNKLDEYYESLLNYNKSFKEKTLDQVKSNLDKSLQENPALDQDKFINDNFNEILSKTDPKIKKLIFDENSLDLMKTELSGLINHVLETEEETSKKKLLDDISKKKKKISSSLSSNAAEISKDPMDELVDDLTSVYLDLDVEKENIINDENLSYLKKFPNLKFSGKDESYSDSEIYLRNLHFYKKNLNLGSSFDGNTYFPHNDLNIRKTNQTSLSINTLLACGAHLGQSKALFRSSTQPFIYGVYKGLHIIDLNKTISYLKRACKVIQGVVQNNGLVLFIGTRDGQEKALQNAASIVNGYYVSSRWIPGTLTNATETSLSPKKTIVDPLNKIVNENVNETQTNSITKPDLIVVLNMLENEVVLQEAMRCNIPTIGIVDTDCNPSLVTYPIPANDDSIRCTNVITTILASAGYRGKQKRYENYSTIQSGNADASSLLVED